MRSQFSKRTINALKIIDSVEGYMSCELLYIKTPDIRKGHALSILRNCYLRDLLTRKKGLNGFAYKLTDKGRYVAHNGEIIKDNPTPAKTALLIMFYKSTTPRCGNIYC